MRGIKNVLGLIKTHYFGHVAEIGSGSECNAWEDLQGGTVWAAFHEDCGERGKEECVTLISERVWKNVTDYEWKYA